MNAGSVGGVARRARQHGDAALGAERVDRGAVVVERGEDARHPLGRELAAALDADAEPRDRAAAVELGDGAGPRVDVRDEQPRRVRSDVDDRDAHDRHASLPRRVRHRLARERREQVVHGHLGHPLARRDGRRPDVREHDQVGRAQQRVVGRKRFGVGHVERRGPDPAVAQRGRERDLVDDPAAGGVHEDRAGLHRGERRAHRSGGGWRA